jgi:hypothetical protein
MISTIRSYAPPVPPQRTGNFRQDTDASIQYLYATLWPYQSAWLRDFANAFNSGPQGLGADIASAATISFTSFAHRVTGTATILTINVPPAIAFAGQLILLSMNGFGLATGGNISATRGVLPKTLVSLFYSQPDQLWFPNA